jgi:hypothetical protein
MFMADGKPGGARITLQDAIDLHLHFGPEPLSRRLSGRTHTVDPVEAVKDAEDFGMAAVVLKAHEFASTSIAHLADQVNSVTVFGGICCDYPVGGLNPIAVETALANGAKIVWLPTISSQQMKKADLVTLFGTDVGISVLDDEGALVKPVKVIMDLVAQYDGVLATGHISTAEHFAVAKYFGHRGRLIVTHAMQPDFGPTLSKEHCKELADLGAIIEFTAHTCLGPPSAAPKVLEAVRLIGTKSVVMSTDYGWSDELPRPAAGFKTYVEAMWDEGATEADLLLMVSENPARLLGMR